MKVPNRQPTGKSRIDSVKVRESLRNEIPAARNWAYFDHAAVSPLPKRSADAASKMLTQCAESGDIHWPEWASFADQLRLSSADLLHCTPQEIALVPNTTFGINLIAQVFPWFSETNAANGNQETAEALAWQVLEGKAEANSLPHSVRSHPNAPQYGERPNVVIFDNEFSSNLLAWENLTNYGIEVRTVKVPASGIITLDSIREKIDRHTKLVSISWVNYLTGYRIDLEKVCELVHEAGAQLFLDAIQGLGVFPCDLSSIPIDYVAADGHKWMLGPEGAGLLYIRSERLPSLAPAMLGWNSLRGAHHFSNQGYSFKPDASRYEGGSANQVGLIALESSLRILLDLGCNQPVKDSSYTNGVAQAVLENAAMIREELRRIGAEVYCEEQAAENAHMHLSGIVTFNLPGQSAASVRSRLIQDKVVCSVRHNRVRLATHAYNDAGDVEKLIHSLTRKSEDRIID